MQLNIWVNNAQLDLVTKVFHRIIDTVSKNILDLDLFFDYDLEPLSFILVQF